jgi:hypothetical protein
MLISVIVFVISFGQAVFAGDKIVGENCHKGLTDTGSGIRFTFSDLERLSASYGGKRSSRGEVLSRVAQERVTRFWNAGWPALNQIAKDSEISVAELFKIYYDLVNLWISEAGGPRDVAVWTSLATEVRRAVELLSQLKPGQKMKGNQWDAVRSLHSGINSLGLFVVSLERNWRTYPSFNPYDVKYEDPSSIMALFDSAENLSLDLIIRDLYGESENQPEEAEAEDKAEQQVTSLGQEQIGTIPDSTNESERTVSSDMLSRLEYVLRGNLPLHHETVYVSKNPRNKSDLNVLLSKQIVEMDDRHGNQLRRLLRSIAIGNGFKSGIKYLSEIGLDIVEVKAVMKGHWRLLGCLKGNRLELLKMLEMPESIGGYGRIVPGNLCRER